MIPEIGHFLLILAAVTALLVPVAVFRGVASGNAVLTRLWRPAALIVAAGMTGASAALMHAFLTDDFSVAYVANHSNTKLAAVYKAAAFWGGHEGSILLWTLFMAWGALWLARRSQRLNGQRTDAPEVAASVAASGPCGDAFTAKIFDARTGAVLLLVIGGFSLFILATSNPFLRLLPDVPTEGRDLNPVLQDIGMILHPPVLFLGYAGLAVMFAVMSALLSEGAWRRGAVRLVTQVAVVTWIFLTAGNMLGSWWAYTELGWGGWWFWDPVENASFIPWLTTTALLHALIQTKATGQLKRLSIFLSLFGFALCLLGTLIVRSGLMQSVHAFATDPTRGTALFVLMIAIMGPATALYAMRVEKTAAGEETSPTTDDGLMTAGIFLVTAAAFGVLFGTLYPLAYDMAVGKSLTVGAPYFNSFFAPMALLAAVLVGAAQLRGRGLVSAGVCAVLSLAAGGALAFTTDPRDLWMTAAAVSAAAWIVSTAAAGFLPKTFGGKMEAEDGRHHHHHGRHAAKPRRPGRLSWPALVAHVGIAVSILGAVGVEQFEKEALVRMGPGLGRPLDDVVFVYTETRAVSMPSYYGRQAVIEVRELEGEALITTLLPERQTFISSGMQMSAAGIDHGLTRDLYVSLGNALEDGTWLVRLSIKPFAGWIWGGGLIMMLGGFLVLLIGARKHRASHHHHHDHQHDAPAGTR